MSQTEKQDKEARARKKKAPEGDQPAPAGEQPVTAEEKPAQAEDQGAGEGVEKAEDRPEGSPGPEWEKELEVYPLREASEDPKWAVRTVWIWIGFGLISLAFILVLLVLGLFYD